MRPKHEIDSFAALNLIIALYPDELSLKLLGFQASH